MVAEKLPDGRVRLLCSFASVSGSLKHGEILIPCGQCLGCRLERSRQWAVRCMHEASLHAENCFVTLTYSDECLPPYGALRYKDFQDFMKRLRKRISPKRVSFFMCGEYGDNTFRPHYHACLFGYNFPDRRYRSKSATGERLYESAFLADLWRFGAGIIGDVTFRSAGYVARYCVKKVTGDLADQHYSVVDLDTGEIVRRPSEFAHMSLRPAIAKDWINRYLSDVYPHNLVVVDNKKCKPPKYYDRQFVLCKLREGLSQLQAEAELEAIKSSSILKAEEHRGDSTPQRLADREEVTRARLSFLKRHKEGF